MFGQLPEKWAASSVRSRTAAVGVLLIGLFGSWAYTQFLDGIYPVKLWLIWRVATVWLWTALFSVACTCFGQFMLHRVLRVRGLPALESAVFAMSTGVVMFAMAMYAAGALGLYHRALSLILPAVMIGVGIRDTTALARSLWAEWHVPEPHKLTSLALSAGGVICIGIIWLGILSPDSLNYDAAWTHQVIAQEYARNGRIVPFIADYNRNVPHLASLIYTWCYLLPGNNNAVRYMLSLHGEFALFLWTLVSVSAAIRAILDDQTLRRSWLSFWLFPVIFVYDNNLGGASDHVCGFFSVPIALAAMRLCERFSPGNAALFAIAGAGAVLTKFQALFLVLPAGIVVAVCWLRQAWLHVRRRRNPAAPAPAATLQHLLWAPGIVIGLGLVLFSPHAIRQWIFYNNPVYPFAQDVFDSRPTVPNAAFLVSHALADPLYQPEGTLWEKFKHACELFVTFSFVPHYSFTRDQPAFGSLFTLLFPCVFFIRNRRLWFFAAVAAGAVLVWGMIYNVDRNLQTFMPVLVCVTGAIVIAGWRMGWLARIGLVPILAVQLTWGSDALLYSQEERIRDAFDLIKTGYEGEAHKRWRRYRHEFLALGKAMPKDARALLHAAHTSLGIEREVLLDGIGFQGLITFDHLTTPRELYDYFKGFGITHLIDLPGGSPTSTTQEEVLWDALMSVYAQPTARYNAYRMAPMPKEPPPETAPFVVASIGQWGYKDGLYPIKALNTIRFLPEHKRFYADPSEELPADKTRWREIVAKADAVIVERNVQLEPSMKSLLKKQFVVIRNLRHDFTVHLANTHVPAGQVPNAN